jgi:hypothetical protein
MCVLCGKGVGVCIVQVRLVSLLRVSTPFS